MSSPSFITGLFGDKTSPRQACETRWPMLSGNQITATVKAVATIQIHVIPNAKNDKIAGDHGDVIKIKLRAAAL